MKKILVILSVCCAVIRPAGVSAQGMHFSQYYNAPMLLNPANTALMPDNDFRLGVNYRKQWATVPVPYRTYSAYADFQALRNRNTTNWLGLGVAFFNDKVGDGDLSLSRTEAFVAYHLQMGYSSMISAGLSGGYSRRTVDFNKLSFDAQWDGFKFDRTLPSGEGGYVGSTSYFDIGVGVNYAYFPNENVYIKMGAGVAHVNQPKETFYNMTNKMGMRPTANVDALFRLNAGLIFNPSIYYTTQKGAFELLYGSLLQFNIGDAQGRLSNQVIIGAYNRWNESVIGAVGYQWNGMKLMSSYDFTISKLGKYNNGNGGFELSVIYEGLYGDNSRARQSYNCPRF